MFYAPSSYRLSEEDRGLSDRGFDKEGVCSPICVGSPFFGEQNNGDHTHIFGEQAATLGLHPRVGGGGGVGLARVYTLLLTRFWVGAWGHARLDKKTLPSSDL